MGKNLLSLMKKNYNWRIYTVFYKNFIKAVMLYVYF